MELVSTAKAAEILGVTLTSVRNRLKDGKLTAFARDGGPWQQGALLYFSLEEIESLAQEERGLYPCPDEAEWIDINEAAAILGINPRPMSRLARDGLLTAKMGREPGAVGRPGWYFLRSSVEARAALMVNVPDPTIAGNDDWIPLREARVILGLTRWGVKGRMELGLLESAHFGPPNNLALYLRRSQCEYQAAHPIQFPRLAPVREIAASRDDRIWFAGFFDGEGCVHIRNPIPSQPGWVLTMSLANSGIDALRYAHSVMGGGLTDRPRQKAHYRDQMRWSTSCDDALAVLLAIRPFLRVKHLQADLGIEFQERVRSDRFGHRHEMPESEKEWRRAQSEKMSRLNRPNVSR